jgi:hypothetical protein
MVFINDKHEHFDHDCYKMHVPLGYPISIYINLINLVLQSALVVAYAANG